jgi:hypothetical protein
MNVDMDGGDGNNVTLGMELPNLETKDVDVDYE